MHEPRAAGETARVREVDHIYVTGWYFLAAMGWFPCLFFIANLPGIHYVVDEATVNWWFAHNCATSAMASTRTNI